MTAGVLAIAASVLLIAGCASTPTMDGSSTVALDPIVGTVVAGPSCPVERVRIPCPPRAVVAGAVALLRAGTVVQTTHTDATGHFRFDASPGAYELQATNVGGYRSTVARAVVVSASTAVVLTLDSGIR